MIGEFDPRGIDDVRRLLAFMKSATDDSRPAGSRVPELNALTGYDVTRPAGGEAVRFLERGGLGALNLAVSWLQELTGLPQTKIYAELLKRTTRSP